MPTYPPASRFPRHREARKPVLSVDGTGADPTGNVSLGAVRKADFSDVTAREGMTLNEVGAVVNTLVRKLKGTVAAFAALLAVGAFAEYVPLSPDMDFGDIDPHEKLKAVVEASGATGSTSTNDVRRIVDSSFRGGTQEVNRVTGAFDAVADAGTNSYRRVPGVSIQTNRIAVANGYIDAGAGYDGEDFVPGLTLLDPGDGSKTVYSYGRVVSGTNSVALPGRSGTFALDGDVAAVSSRVDGVAAYTGTLDVRKRNRFDMSAGWVWSSSDAGCPPAVVAALNGAMNFPYPDVIEGTANLSWGVSDVRTNGVFLARCVGPLTYPASADVREMTFRFSTNPVATEGFDFEATARRLDSLATSSSVAAATNGLRKVDGAMRALPKYLWEKSFDDTYPDDAAWYYAQPQDYGSCSAVRSGGFLYRNYDWKFDEAAEFVVKVGAGPGRFASVGVANVGTNLTEETVTSGGPSRYYKCLPGHTVDGVNSEGVVAEVNVVSTDGVEDWRGDPETDGIHCLGAVRWVLDNATSAEMAATSLAARVYVPEGMGNFHYMIADETATYVVENGTASNMTGRVVMTNFPRLPPISGGMGIERYLLLVGGANITNAWYTNAYRRDTNWSSEFKDAEEMEAAKSAWETYTREQLRGHGLWQTVHTSVYDLTNRTLRVAVQETDDWYVFQVPVTAPKVDAYTKSETDAKLAGKLDLSGGTMTGPLEIGGGGISVEGDASVGGQVSAGYVMTDYVFSDSGTLSLESDEVTVTEGEGVSVASGVSVGGDIEAVGDIKKDALPVVYGIGVNDENYKHGYVVLSVPKVGNTAISGGMSAAYADRAAVADGAKVLWAGDDPNVLIRYRDDEYCEAGWYWEALAGGSMKPVAKLATTNDVAGKLDDDFAAMTNSVAFTSAVARVSPPVDISGKVDKVAHPTTGNFAELTADGNIKDSGNKASDFAPAVAGGYLPLSGGDVNGTTTFFGGFYVGPQGDILGVTSRAGYLYKQYGATWYYGDELPQNEIAVKGDIPPPQPAPDYSTNNVELVDTVKTVAGGHTLFASCTLGSYVVTAVKVDGTVVTKRVSALSSPHTVFYDVNVVSCSIVYDGDDGLTSLRVNGSLVGSGTLFCVTDDGLLVGVLLGGRYSALRDLLAQGRADFTLTSDLNIQIDYD